MTASIWIITAIILFVIEIVMPTAFFFMCLGIGAIAAGVSVLFIVDSMYTWLIFVSVSLGSIYLIKPVAAKLFHKKIKKSNVDALIGQKAVVVEIINPPALGMVKVEGELWRAEALETIDLNSMVEVFAVEGTRLKVKKIV